MTQTPFLLVPGLNCTAENFAAQIPNYWRYGPVTIANHTQGA
ncbi:MAG: Alpha/beta hydrolase, partial [Hyphomicrobiales bacterium]|nr:Alpha/beta hydrolase [Hyphomicrobiales bacterium]